ncbi:KEOPS complex subunit Pcc1 [Natronomonas sp.]|uniref:KEOPS complex subunit Pcc1 n=1 Tax=Natronomonas sp. TaxID=2184060 RepID=UPI00260A69C1|nr:KEOPS complex subunit Pcc1 [Natronomonas sp.]
MHTAELHFEYDETRTAELVASAVGQELDEIDGERASATLSRDGSRLTVGVDAADLVALRAGLNTWETLLEVAERTVQAGA